MGFNVYLMTTVPVILLVRCVIMEFLESHINCTTILPGIPSTLKMSE